MEPDLRMFFIVLLVLAVFLNYSTLKNMFVEHRHKSPLKPRPPPDAEEIVVQSMSPSYTIIDQEHTPTATQDKTGRTEAPLPLRSKIKLKTQITDQKAEINGPKDRTGKRVAGLTKDDIKAKWTGNCSYPSYIPTAVQNQPWFPLYLQHLKNVSFASVLQKRRAAACSRWWYPTHQLIRGEYPSRKINWKFTKPPRDFSRPNCTFGQQKVKTTSCAKAHSKLWRALDDMGVLYFPRSGSELGVVRDRWVGFSSPQDSLSSPRGR